MTNEKAIELLEDVKKDYLQRGSSSYDSTSAEAVEYAMDAINKNAEMENKLACLEEDLQTLSLKNVDYIKEISMLNDKIKHQAGQINAYRYCLECMGRGKDQDSEKQIPKKPDYEGDGYDENGNLIYDTWICPSCESKYEVDYDEYEHCPKCGQALDWRDEI